MVASLRWVAVAQVLFDFDPEVSENKQGTETQVVSRASYLYILWGATTAKFSRWEMCRILEQETTIERWWEIPEQLHKVMGV